MAVGTIVLPVQAAKIGGAFITTGAQIDGGQGTWKLLFDTTTEESGLWMFKMPDNFASGLTSVLQYAMASATSSTVAFDISVMAVADGENIDTTSFDTVNSTGAITVPGTAGFVDTLTTTLTNADSIAADELCIIKISRDVALDGAAGDAELLTVTIEYTTT